MISINTQINKQITFKAFTELYILKSTKFAILTLNKYDYDKQLKEFENKEKLSKFVWNVWTNLENLENDIAKLLAKMNEVFCNYSDTEVKEYIFFAGKKTFTLLRFANKETNDFVNEIGNRYNVPSPIIFNQSVHIYESPYFPLNYNLDIIKVKSKHNYPAEHVNLWQVI